MRARARAVARAVARAWRGRWRGADPPHAYDVDAVDAARALEQQRLAARRPAAWRPRDLGPQLLADRRGDRRGRRAPRRAGRGGGMQRHSSVEQLDRRLPQRRAAARRHRRRATALDPAAAVLAGALSLALALAAALGLWLDDAQGAAANGPHPQRYAALQLIAIDADERAQSHHGCLGRDRVGGVWPVGQRLGQRTDAVLRLGHDHGGGQRCLAEHGGDDDDAALLQLATCGRAGAQLTQRVKRLARQALLQPSLRRLGQRWHGAGRKAALSERRAGEQTAQRVHRLGVGRRDLPRDGAPALLHPCNLSSQCPQQ
jgi:hypothetical protein